MIRPGPTPETLSALADARAQNDLVRHHRRQAAEHAVRRNHAALRANIHGASYRTIARALDAGVGTVQQWLAAATLGAHAGPQASPRQTGPAAARLR